VLPFISSDFGVNEWIVHFYFVNVVFKCGLPVVVVVIFVVVSYHQPNPIFEWDQYYDDVL
jgi:hypothetical protein